MIQEDSPNHGQYGRHTTPLENEVWAYYELLLDKNNAKGYDRASVHNAIPEIREAFDKVTALGTFYALTDGPHESDYE